MLCREVRPLLDRLVLVGGCATGLLITDKAAAPPRPTQDVDMIVQVAGLADYYAIEDVVRKLGFTQGEDDHGVICRWRKGLLQMDLMPTDKKIFGFANSWYPLAIECAQLIEIDKISIHCITAPVFLATKMEAFHDRGKSDFMASHDFEDVIAVIDGRASIVSEFKVSGKKLRRFLNSEFHKILSMDNAEEIIACHLPPDTASQQRIGLVMERIKKISMPLNNDSLSGF